MITYLLADGVRNRCEECIERGLYKQKSCKLKGTYIPGYKYPVYDEVLDYCPFFLLEDENLMDTLSLMVLMERGFLPFSGGLMDQPYRLIQLFLIYLNAKGIWERVNFSNKMRNG